jgi:WD40 repeat protein
VWGVPLRQLPVRWWLKISTGDCTELRPFLGHTSYVTSVAWNADGSKLASGSGDKTVMIWSAASGEQIAEVKGSSATNKGSSAPALEPRALVHGL